jgi:hypothetical protein
MGARIRSSLRIAYSPSFFCAMIIIFLVFLLMMNKERVTIFLGFQNREQKGKLITVNKNLK